MRVDNVLGSQVGHLPAKLMVKLAPYIDSGNITVEGLINGHKGVRYFQIIPSL